MRKGIHPENYREVVFKDQPTGQTWVSKSTIDTDKTIEWEDGKEYPFVTVDISNLSHPFYTGSQRTTQAGGRIDKFKKKYNL